MTEPLDLEPIKARLVAATPGPWRPDDEYGPRYVATDPHGKGFWNVWICTPGREGDGGWEREEDADLACHAPTDIAALIAEVERLRGAVMYASNFAEDSQQIRYFESLLPPQKP